MARIHRALLVFTTVAVGCASSQGDPRWGGGEFDQFFDSMVDRHLEAGYEDPVLQASDPLLEQRTIVVTTTINERTAKDVIVRLLYLNRADPTAPIDLFLSTQGGWLDSTFAVVDAIELVSAPVNVWGIGGVYSAGSLILASGSGRRVASAHAIISIHANLEAAERGPASALKLRRFEGFWQRRANLPKEWFPMTGDTTHYLSPEQALSYGIIDAIAELPSGARGHR